MFFFSTPAVVSSDGVHDNRISISLDNKIGNGLLREESVWHSVLRIFVGLASSIKNYGFYFFASVQTNSALIRDTHSANSQGL